MEREYARSAGSCCISSRMKSPGCGLCSRWVKSSIHHPIRRSGRTCRYFYVFTTSAETLPKTSACAMPHRCAASFSRRTSSALNPATVAVVSKGCCAASSRSASMRRRGRESASRVASARRRKCWSMRRTDGSRPDRASRRERFGRVVEGGAVGAAFMRASTSELFSRLHDGGVRSGCKDR